MRKRIILVLVLVLTLFLPLISGAENQYEGYTFEQLQREYLAILDAMWKTDEWQRVEVPAGVYQVGVEIPAGEWTISHNNLFSVKIGPTLETTKAGVASKGRKVYTLIEAKEYKNGWTVKLEAGDYIELSKAVYFTVPVKGQGFSFK